MRRIYELTESVLDRMVKEAVDEALGKMFGGLSEAGDMHGQDSDGTVWTSSKKTYRGVPGSTLIWHGDWSDPEIAYKGQLFNYFEVEDYAWDLYKEFCEENGRQPTEGEFDQLPQSWFQDVLDNEVSI